MIQFSSEVRAALEKKFFKDPEWPIIQKAVLDRIRDLEGLSAIDLTKSAEDVKCQVKGHKLAQEILFEFFASCGILPPEGQISKSETDFR